MVHTPVDTEAVSLLRRLLLMVEVVSESVCLCEIVISSSRDITVTGWG